MGSFDRGCDGGTTVLAYTTTAKADTNELNANNLVSFLFLLQQFSGFSSSIIYLSQHNPLRPCTNGRPSWVNKDCPHIQHLHASPFPAPSSFHSQTSRPISPSSCRTSSLFQDSISCMFTRRVVSAPNIPPFLLSPSSRLELLFPYPAPPVEPEPYSLRPV